MKFIKAVVHTWIIALIMINSGCQVMPSKEKPPSTEEVAQRSTDSNVEPPVRLPNPYLTGRAPAPKAARKRFELAKQAMRDQQWQQAQFDLEWLIKSYPKLSGPYLNLALLYRQIEQPEKAQVAFKQAIAINSNNVSAYNQYAIFLREQGQFDDALKIYSKALEVWPDHPESHRNLGILYDLFMGKPDQALPHYKRYQSLLQKPDRAVAGWIADTERRLKQTGQTQ